MSEIKDKIYIQLLDGAEVWIPVDAKAIGYNRFEILPDKEYTDGYVNSLYLHEFYPGDIVELNNHTFSDGNTGLVATKLIKAGEWPNRKFNEFKFKAALGQLNFDKDTATLYQSEIERVKNEISQGQVYYQGIHDAINFFTQLAYRF